MKTALNLTILLFTFLALSCGSKEGQIEKLQSDAMEVHDEVMPKMDTIMKLKKSLKAEQDSTTATEDEEIQDLIIALEESDKAMMNWMRNYDPKMEDMTDDEKIAYLTKQKISIQEVSEQMKSSISEAEAYLMNQ